MYSFADKLALSRKEVAHQSDLMSKDRCASLTSELDRLRSVKCADEPGEERRSQLSKRSCQCTECPKSFACASDLARHRRTHTNERPYVCDVCSSSFKTRNQLTVHSRVHSGRKPYPCDMCDKAFAQSSHKKTQQQQQRPFNGL